MESGHQQQVDSPPRHRYRGLKWGALLLFLGVALLLSAHPVAADCPPDPPACCGGTRGLGDSGDKPDKPPPPTLDAPPPVPGDPIPGDGEPGDAGEPPPAGDDGGPSGEGEGAPAYDPYLYYWCISLPQTGCPELANATVYCEYNDCWLVDWTCVSEEVCSRGNDDVPADTVQPPCEPGYGPGGIYLECEGDGENGFEWGYYIHTWANVPPHRVQIRPFPRWLAGTVGTMCLSRSPEFSVSGGPEGAGLAEGFWSTKVAIPPDLDLEEPDLGDIKDYRIGVRWRRLNPGESLFGGPSVPQSCWTFGDRDWNVTAGAPNAACGDCVSHGYETSSWELPQNGAHWVSEAAGCDKVPSAAGQWTNPAYQVQVPTYWVAEWADEWDAWEQVGWEEPEGCFYSATPIPGAAGCSIGAHAGSPGWYQTAGDPIYDWVPYRIGWYPVDLRQFGGSDWWYKSWAVVTTGAGPWCAYEYADPNPGSTVRVPVIEMQSLIVDGCRLDGTCGDLNPPGAESTPPEIPPPPPPAPPDGDTEPPEGCTLCP